METRTSLVTKYHSTVVKLLGISFMLVTILLVILSINIYQSSLEVRTLNLTSCGFAKQYSLGGNTHATACVQNGDAIVDIRKFLNGTATIIGISLDLRQWRTLKRLTSLIDIGIDEHL